MLFISTILCWPILKVFNHGVDLENGEHFACCAFRFLIVNLFVLQKAKISYFKTISDDLKRCTYSYLKIASWTFLKIRAVSTKLSLALFRVPVIACTNSYYSVAIFEVVGIYYLTTYTHVLTNVLHKNRKHWWSLFRNTRGVFFT